MRVFEHSIRVRYGECDVQGRVFHANYLVYCDVATTELWREAGVPWFTMTEQGYDAGVAESTLRYRAPARIDDVVTARMRIAKLGRTSFEIAFRLLRDEELLVEGELRNVVVSTDSWRPAPMPDWLRERLLAFMAEFDDSHR